MCQELDDVDGHVQGHLHDGRDHHSWHCSSCLPRQIISLVLSSHLPVCPEHPHGQAGPGLLQPGQLACALKMGQTLPQLGEDDVSGPARRSAM
jgi:hypothetical protein